AVTCVYTDLVPFEPPARPLGLLSLRTLMRNYIETVPRSAYDQNVTHFRTRMSDVLIVFDPDIIQELLVDEAEAFGRDPTTRRSFAPIIGNTALFLAEGADWRLAKTRRGSDFPARDVAVIRPCLRCDGAASGRALAQGGPHSSDRRRGGNDTHHI
ncbi:MAG: hypothetical protein WCF52_03190, partial [Pseudolabrys sp.]